MLLAELGEDDFVGASISAQTIRAETSWVVAGLPPDFSAYPVDDLFRSLGPLTFFEARRAWSRPKEVRVPRLEDGFGFSIKGEFPVVVAAVDSVCPAERAGVRSGDVLIQVQGQDVRWCSHERIIQLVRSAGVELCLWLVTPKALPKLESESALVDNNASIRLAGSAVSSCVLQQLGACPSHSVPLKQRKNGNSTWKKRLSGSWLFRRRTCSSSGSAGGNPLCSAGLPQQASSLDSVKTKLRA